MPAIYLILGALLFPLALYGMFARRNLVLKLVAANIAASAVFLVLVSAPPRPEGGGADPVPQALVLTGIVISVSVTAFALSVIRRLIDETGRMVLQEGDED